MKKILLTIASITSVFAASDLEIIQSVLKKPRQFVTPRESHIYSCDKSCNELNCKFRIAEDGELLFTTTGDAKIKRQMTVSQAIAYIQVYANSHTHTFVFTPEAAEILKSA